MDIEDFARKILGNEAYDNSPCQAHPFELIDFEVNRLRAENERLRAEVERYQWLRRQDWVTWRPPGFAFVIGARGRDLDQEIDAMRGEGK